MELKTHYDPFGGVMATSFLCGSKASKSKSGTQGVTDEWENVDCCRCLRQKENIITMMKTKFPSRS